MAKKIYSGKYCKGKLVEKIYSGKFSGILFARISKDKTGFQFRQKLNSYLFLKQYKPTLKITSLPPLFHQKHGRKNKSFKAFIFPLKTGFKCDRLPNRRKQ
ncbi:hypothetical protein [Bartonella apis]|uniref:hypothetical protein n=1 Tax=Bartonella apis TaxID=1686310 RepID=UPI001AEE023B|nr:hypothetical protein [Bartonella apis]